MNLKKAVSYIMENVSCLSYMIDFYGMQFQKKGSQHFTSCILHPDMDPSFAVDTKKNVWYCYGCKSGGSIISFVEQYENIPRAKAILHIIHNLNIDKDQFYNKNLSLSDMRINELVHDFFMQQALIYPEFADYFKPKGYILEEVIKWGVGYCNSIEELYDYLKEKGVTVNDIVRFGFDNPKWNKAIIFPIRDLFGQVSYFKIRSLEKSVKNYEESTEYPTYQENLWYGLYDLKKGSQVLLVEGESDCLAAIMKGYNAIAMGGVKLSHELLDVIQSFEIQDVVLWPDGDAAGYSLIRSATKKYKEFFSDRLMTGLALFYPMKDPDEVLNLERNPDIEEDAKLIPFVYIDKAYPHLDSEVYSHTKIMKMINQIAVLMKEQSPVIKDLVASYVAAKTGISSDSIREVFIQKTYSIDYGVEKHVVSCILQDRDVISKYGIFNGWFQSKIANIIYEKVIKNDATYYTIKGFLPEDYHWYVDSLPIPRFEDLKYEVKYLKENNDRFVIKKVASKILDHQGSHHELMSMMNDELDKFYRQKDEKVIDYVESMKSIIENAVNGNSVIGYDLGKNWIRTNRVLLGIKPKLIIILGNTGHGKTNVVLNWVESLSLRQNKKALIFSGEMSPSEITTRLISMHTNIGNTSINTNNLSNDNVQEIIKLIKSTNREKLFIDGTMEFDKLIGKIKYMKIKHDIDYVVIDYAQLLQPSKSMEKMTKTQQLKEMTGILKTVIVEGLNLPVVLVGQLSDQALDDAIPSIRRSSESKIMMNDADVGIAMRKKNKKEKELEPMGDIIFHIEKVRYNKGEQVIYLTFNDKSLRISEV